MEIIWIIEGRQHINSQRSYKRVARGWKLLKGDVKMELEVAIMAFKMEEVALRQKCEEPLKAGKGRKMSPPLESPWVTQPCVSILDF